MNGSRLRARISCAAVRARTSVGAIRKAVSTGSFGTGEDARSAGCPQSRRSGHTGQRRSRGPAEPSAQRPRRASGQARRPERRPPRSRGSCERMNIILSIDHPPANNLSGKRVLVTGGSGFLGTYVLKTLAAAGAAEVLVPRPAQYDPREREAIPEPPAHAPPDRVAPLAPRGGWLRATMAA